MVANRQVLSLLLAALLPVLVVAQYPMIEETEGFEVDMEPFWVETEYDDSNSVPLDVQGYFKTEMEVVLPNIMGVLLRRYDDDGSTTSTMDLEGEETRTNSTARVFYTGMAVFRGPPFRTNHDVYQAQTAAMTSLQAAKTYLKVHDASLGIPDWFNSTALENPDKAVMMEETDGSLTINPDLLLESNAKGSKGSLSSLEGIAVGGAVGLVVGAVLTFIGMFCYKRHLKGNRNSSSSAPCTPRRHKRKSSDDSDLPVNDPHNQLGDPQMDFDIDINNNGGGSSSSEGHDEGGDFLPESFHDEEVADGEEVISFTNSPVRSKDITPRKRRPSHHRRWKSTATFTDMQSPSSVMDGLFMNGSPPTSSTSNSTTDSSSSHRRSSSFADAFGVGGLHRRSKSVADAFSESVADVLTGTVNTQASARDRRDSMMELLGGVDMADLMNDLDMDLDRLE